MSTKHQIREKTTLGVDTGLSPNLHEIINCNTIKGRELTVIQLAGLVREYLYGGGHDASVNDEEICSV